MYEEYFTESHNMLRDSLKEFLAREISPYIDQWEKEGIFPRELYKKAGDAGFMGLGFPEEYGGTQADIFHSVAYGCIFR